MGDLIVYRCLFAVCERAGDKALPALSEAASDEDEYIRHLSVCILMKRIVPAEATIPLLVDALADANAFTQLSAVVGLGAYGPEASKATKMIERLAEVHAEEHLRNCAAEAVKKLRGRKDEAQR